MKVSKTQLAKRVHLEELLTFEIDPTIYINE